MSRLIRHTLLGDDQVGLEAEDLLHVGPNVVFFDLEYVS
eukprot:XP_001708670.1 Hypothetical protein GL50803_32319 [Giardia lamblia ATCC 50803]